MYYYIKGTVVFKNENSVAIDANGVAYLMNTTLLSLQSIGEVGREATMYTYLHVREDVMELYGFAGADEKDMFMLLISVSGVGPKAALAILSVLSPDKFAVSVITNDVKSITKAAGVGPKLAQRIILELRDKLKDRDLGLDGNDDAAAEFNSDSKNEAVSALVSLGYGINDAKAMVKNVDAGLGVEDIIKKALLGL